MKLASHVTVVEGSQTKQFTEKQFRQVMRSSFFTGAVTFWRSLEGLSCPDAFKRTHAMGVLKEMARQAYEDCGGVAYSPTQAECLEYCGLKPKGVRPPGTAVKEKPW